MRRTMTSIGIGMAVCLTTALALTATVVRKPVSPAAELSAGKVELKSAGPLAFGPAGILFVGDSIGGSVVGDRYRRPKAATSAVKSTSKESM